MIDVTKTHLPPLEVQMGRADQARLRGDPCRGERNWQRGAASCHPFVVSDTLWLRGQVELVGFLEDLDAARRNIDFCEAKVL